MKKTYFVPTLDVVEIKYANQLLAGSLPRSTEVAPVDGSGDYESLSREFDW